MKIFFVLFIAALSGFSSLSLAVETSIQRCTEKLHAVIVLTNIPNNLTCDSYEEFFSQTLQQMNIDDVNLTCSAEISALPNTSRTKQKLQRDFANTLNGVEIFKSKYGRMKQNCVR